MKQTMRHILPLLFLLPLLCACQEELPFAPEADGHYLSLSLATQANTRATEEGEDSFNENKIERADVYFFQVNATAQDEEECIYAQLGLRPTLVSGSRTDYTLQVPLDKTIISEGTEYYVYVVANHDFNYTGETAKGVTLGTIKQRAITTEWKSGYKTDGTAEDNVEKVKESSLVMDGGEDIAIQSQPTTSEIINMTRAMAKVTLSASTATQIESNGLTYTPIPSRMFTTLVYAVQCTNLAVDYTVNAKQDYITRMRRNYNETPTNVTVNGEQRERYSQVAPFYSYPNPKTTTDRRDSYLILCVPWMAQAEGSESYQAMNYYYRVPITGSEAPALLERNHYYKINVHIGVLGSLNPNEAVELTAEFEIMDWFEVGIDADINQYQYLVLDEYSSVMNNVDEIRMPYISSSQLAWPDTPGIKEGEFTKIVSVSYTDYSSVDFSTKYLSTEEISESYFLTENGDRSLLFQHTIEEDAFVCYTITIDVYNTDGVKADTWTIYQYPAIYIEGNRANYKLYVAGHSSNNTSGQGWGNTGQDYWYDEVTFRGYDLGTVHNPDGVDGTGENRNPNNYTIYVTSFDVGDNYIIGDPRKEEVDNLDIGVNNYYNEGLTNYHPTRGDDDTKRVIAPAFKIASSRGKTMPVTYDNAKRRCAAYQEDGYGAGRWRLPTEAEIEFIVNLSTGNNRKIPTLFDGSYWSASGQYYNSDDREFHSPNNNRYTCAVRCVYDVWYWGDERADKPDEFDWRDDDIN
mgnify:CR=1 FL=1